MNYQPTDLAPGTVEKIEVLRERARIGVPLFHPHDRNDYRGLSNIPLTTRRRNAARIGGYRTVAMFASRKRLAE